MLPKQRRDTVRLVPASCVRSTSAVYRIPAEALDRTLQGCCQSMRECAASIAGRGLRALARLLRFSLAFGDQPLEHPFHPRQPFAQLAQFGVLLLANEVGRNARSQRRDQPDTG